MPLKQHLRAAALGTACLGAFLPSAQSYSIDRPHFEVDPMVIVWAVDDADPDGGPKVMDFVTLDNGVSTDAIGGTAVDGRAVVTGSLAPTPDTAWMTGDQIGLRDLTDNSLQTVSVSNPTGFQAFDVEDQELEYLRDDGSNQVTYNNGFFVASNTGYRIRSDVVDYGATGDLQIGSIALSTVIIGSGTYGGLQFGTRSQSPAVTYAYNPSNRVPILSFNGKDIITVNGPTAAQDGTIAQQSVFHQMRYWLTSTRFSGLEVGTGEIYADIVYTVYVL
ncbi:MAG: hypothetical protein AAGA72_06935 [Pseudomonadota bacterium]